MLRNRRTAVALCALGLAPVMPARVLSAQQTQDASPELIDAILRHVYRYDGGNVRLLSGRVPDDLGPNFYLPPGSRVIGSVVAGSSVVVFATSSVPFDSVRALYTRALAPAGWKPLTWRTPMGFVDSRRASPVVLCRDGAQLHVQRLSPTGGSNDLVLNYRDSLGSCETGAQSAMPPMRQTRFPTLYSPEPVSESAMMRCASRGGTMVGMATATSAVAISGSGMSTGATRRSGTSTTIVSTMRADELLRHYGAQLEAGGWRRSSVGGGQAGSGRWTLADTAGVRDVTLSVANRGVPGGGCYEVRMELTESPR
jgi:hypothetical protein